MDPRATPPTFDQGPSWARALGRAQERHPRWFLGAIVVVTLAVAWPLAHARFSGDLSDLLPADSAAARAFERFRNSFEQSDQLVVVATRKGAGGPSAAEWIAALRARLEKRPEVRRVEGGPLETLTEFATKVLPSAGFAWLTTDEATKLRATLEPEGLARAFARDVRILEQTPSLDTTELVRRDPLFLREIVAGRAAGFFGGSMNGGGEDALALVSIAGHRPAQDVPASRVLVAAVDAEIAAVDAEFESAGRRSELSLIVTGGYRIAVEDEARIRQDLGGSTVSSIALVLIVSYLAHRRLVPVLFIAIPLLLGVAWGYGCFLTLRGGITMLTAVGAAMLVGLGDDYGVHLYSEYARVCHEGADPKTARVAMIARAAPRIVVAALTSVGCFVAFVLTGFRGLSDLGLLSGIGLLTCLAAFLVSFPLLLRRHTPHVGRTPLSLVADGLAAIPLRWPRGSLALVGLVVLGSLALLLVRGVPPFVGDARLLHPKNSPALDALAELDRIVKRPLVPWIVLAEGDDADELTSRFKRLDACLAPLVQEGALLSYELPTRVLPPKAEQEAAFAALASPAPLDPQATVEHFRAAAETAGFDATFFSSWCDSLRANLERVAQRQVVTLAELRSLGANALADTFFRRADGHLVAAAFLFPDTGLFPGPEQERLVDRIRVAVASAPTFALTGFPVVAAELADRVRKDFSGVTLLAVGVVVLLVLISCRSIGATVLALLPVALALLWLLALMRLTDTPFNVLNVVLMPMLVGLGVDNGIHVVFDTRATGDVGSSMRSMMLPMLHSAATTISGFGSLMLVQHPAIASMGLLSAAGMTFDLVATLLVLPPLFLLCRARGQNSK